VASASPFGRPHVSIRSIPRAPSQHIVRTGARLVGRMIFSGCRAAFEAPDAEAED
jgi:hypothetical protein